MAISARSLGFIIVALVAVFFAYRHLSSDHPQLTGIRPVVNESQVRLLDSDDSKSEVAAKLGGEGQHYSSNMGPIKFSSRLESSGDTPPPGLNTGPVRMRNDGSEVSIDGNDCWLYTLSPSQLPDPLNLVAVCFTDDLVSLTLSPYS